MQITGWCSQTKKEKKICIFNRLSKIKNYNNKHLHISVVILSKNQKNFKSKNQGRKMKEEICNNFCFELKNDIKISDVFGENQSDHFINCIANNLRKY